MALLTEGDFKGHFIITAYLCWITAGQGCGGVCGVYSGLHVICKHLVVKSVPSATLNHTCIILRARGPSI